MEQANQIEEQKTLARPIGGWLYLLAIGAVASPIFLIVTISPPYIDIFASGNYEVLTDPDSIGYVYGFRSLILCEIAFNLLLAIILIWQATLFFEKKKLCLILGMLLYSVFL